MKRQIGDRIGAIQSATKDEVRLFGYGTYQGEHVPPDDVMGPFGRLGLYGITNPKLVMDDGTVVWGCESWWGPEGRIRESVAGRSVIAVTPERSPATDEERAEAAALKAEAEPIIESMVAELQAELEAAKAAEPKGA